MHCPCASEGVAQYEANALCLSLQSHDIKLSVLDEFASHVTWPKKFQKCKPPNNFFRERVHDGGQDKDPHLKASGGETLTAVVILGLFISIVVKPSGILKAACASLLLLRDILDLLCDVERAVEQVQHLRSLMRQHHVAFLEAYPDKLQKLIKPKFHLTYHIADCIEWHQVLLSCWSGERMHHTYKAVSANFCRCISDLEQCFALKRLIAGCLQHYQKPHAARKMFFPEGTHVRSEHVEKPHAARHMIFPLGQSMEVANRIHCHLGVVHSGDLVILAGPLLGRVSQFAAAKSTTSGSAVFFVLIHACVQNTARGWWATGPSSSWHFATALEALVPAYELGDGCFRPAIPYFFKI